MSSLSQNSIRAVGANPDYLVSEVELVNCILKQEYLFDYVIDEYVQRQIERDLQSDKYGYIGIHCTSCIQESEPDIPSIDFYKTLLKQCEKCSYIFIPVHEMNHFYLIEIDCASRRLNIIDSLATTVCTQSAKELSRKVENLLNETWGPGGDWTIQITDCPRQNNGYECGYFVIQNITWRIFDCFGMLNERHFTQYDIKILKSEILREFFPKSKKLKDMETKRNLPKKSDKPKQNPSGKPDIATAPLSGLSKHDDTPATDQEFIQDETENSLPFVNIHRVNLANVELQIIKNYPHYDNTVKHIGKQTLEHIPMQTAINTILKLDSFTESEYSLRQRRLLRNVVYDTVTGSALPVVVYYKQTEEKLDPFLKSVGIEISSSSEISSVAFVPIDQKYLYAITTNKAYSLFNRYADFQFLIKVPERILNDKGAKCYQVRSAIGSKRSEKIDEKTHMDLNDIEVGQICQSYSAMLKNEAKEIIFPKYVKDIHVEVGVYRIKFRAPLTLAQILYAIVQLEKVYKGEYLEQIKTSQALTRVTLPVDIGTANVLNKNFFSHCLKFLNTTEDMQWFLKSFDICDNWTKAYSQATNVQLHYAEKKVDIGSDPSLEFLLTKLRHHFFSGGICSIKDLQETSISFKYSYKSRKKCPMIACVNGTLYSTETQQYYWRVNNTWYYITDDTIVNSQRQFQAVLSKHLLEHTDPISLQKKWVHEIVEGKDGKKRTMAEDEGIYNTEYKDDVGYYIGDKITPRSIEHFDIIFAPPRSYFSYLYHIKHGFDHTTRDASSQLRNCMQILERLSKSHSKGKLEGTKLTDFYKPKIKTEGKGKNKKEVKIPPIFENDDEMKRIVGLGSDNPRKRVYVMGLLTNPNLNVQLESRSRSSKRDLRDKERNRSLHLEKIVKLEFTQQDLETRVLKDVEVYKVLFTELGKIQAPELVAEICNRLSDRNFVEVRDNKYYVKSRLLLLESYKDFGDAFHDVKVETHKKECCRTINFLLEDYITYFHSLGAKLEIINLSRQLRNMIEPEQFKISEILPCRGKIKKKKKEK